MIDILLWTEELKNKLLKIFENRLLFVGLQGSQRRGEATEESDIDVVVILDKLEINDLKEYKNILSNMIECEKFCGFISGKNEIQNWPSGEIFQFKNDTTAVYGTLEGMIPDISIEDIKNYVQTSFANLYHMAVHGFMYEMSADNLKQINKSLFFLLLGVYYIKTGIYYKSKQELKSALQGVEKEIFDVDLQSLNEQDIENVYSKIINYTSSAICNY